MNANDLQRWIDHLNDDEKTKEIYFKDQQGRYYHADRIYQRMVPPCYEMDLPPNHCFTAQITRYKSSDETKFLLEHPTPITEVFNILHELLEERDDTPKVCATDTDVEVNLISEAQKKIIEAINILHKYINYVAREEQEFEHKPFKIKK